jgi:putative transposase
MVEAGKQFRRVNGHLQLPALRAAVERETTQTVSTAVQDETSNAA